MMTMTVSAHGQVDPSQEPPLEAGEDVADFKKGPGAPPKNGNSKFFKGVKLKNPQTGGTGCPAGTVSATLTDDNKTLALLFDNYVVQAGSSAGVKKDTKNCLVTLPVEVPPDSQFAVVKLDYRGFNSIPKSGRTRYVTVYSVADATTGKQLGRRIRRRFDFQGPVQENYLISSDISAKPVWSACGKNVNFRIDTRATAASNGHGEDVMGTIDSIDASVGTEYHLLWQSCSGKRP
jgi:hypothetical protein